MDSDKKIISSHIFVFPFNWDYVNNEDWLNTCIDERLNVDKFIESLRDGWEEEERKIKNDEDYNTYTYFYGNVRKAIYGKKSNVKINKYKGTTIKNIKYYWKKLINKKVSNRIVTCLNYKNINKNSIYEIYIKNRDDMGKESYKLKIRSIKLKIYDTGVATLSYFLDNYEYKTREDILIINDYGRRIYPQYIPLEKAQDNLLARKVSLKFGNDTIEEDFNYDTKKYPTKVSKIITELLGEKFGSTEKELKDYYSNEKKNILIRPVIDDRMFVICWYSDNLNSSILTKYKDQEYLKNDFWYQYLFIDNEGSTCQDGRMKKDLLLKSTYTRWKDYGTLFGISRYSFVLLCDESNFSVNVLYNYINNIYYEMIILALVQRASILRFSDETSKIASFENKNIYRQIKKLQEYYIRFVNTIYFREVTAQEQGIELYDKLTELMRIEREVKRLDEEIDEIQRYITLETNGSTNKLVNLITYVGLSVSVMGVVATAFPLRSEVLKWLAIFGVPTFMIIWMIQLIKDRR
ncbi:hypothetical protein CLLI_20300 [Clostridium liquoris]|uniref:CorA-like Mg2+ transporter protein n=1 Tax=Clostridium liquoris TaxID=1289519 RepID=A0A2T0B228_9CLOT|nr:hypothetical protein [Clostridium liquoris]PRR77935.1 hypothetical protein CLLI_20300 [Clostridium liquoris]